jgi:hypothetical protein
MPKLWTLVLLIPFIRAPELRAQDAELAPGTRVRIVQATERSASGLRDRGRTHTGTLQAIDSASVTVLVDGRSLSIPRDIVSRLDVSQGTTTPERGMLRGARVGVVMGGAATALITGIALLDDQEDDGDCLDCPPRPKPRKTFFRWLLDADEAADIPVHGLRGAVVGAGVGAVVGAMRRENWVPVWPGSRSVSLTVDPARSGGTGVGLWLRF